MKKTNARYACEEYSHPKCDMKLILIACRDGDTLAKRRKLARETMGVNGDRHLKCRKVRLTWSQLEQLEEYEA